MNPADLPAGTVYVPGARRQHQAAADPASARGRRRRSRGWQHRSMRTWLVLGSVRGHRDFESFEDERLFVVALLDGKA